MRKDNLSMEDDLRPEYDLEKLQLRKVGKQRHRGKTIHLEPDVAKIFPDDNSVNEALRFLIRMTTQNKDLFSETITSKNADS
jgi:hypothetical protein